MSNSKNKVVNAAVAILAFILGVGVTMIVYSVLTGLVTVGTVNGDVIKRADIDDYINMRMNNTTLSYIQDKIHEDSLKELGITVNKDEIDKRVNEVAERNGGVDKFREELEQGGNSLETYRYNVGKTILSEKATEYYKNKVTVSADEVKEEFNKNKESGSEVALMDVTEYELGEDETWGDGDDINKLDQSKAVVEKGILTSTVFKEIPEVGKTASVVVGTKRMVVKVDAVYQGVENEEVYKYIENKLKDSKAQTEYQKYIEDKTSNADIRLR